MAGVSQSTVSRAFSPNYNLKKELKDKVLKAAEQLSYTPNAIARSLLSDRTGLLGLVTIFSDSPFYSNILKKMSLEAQKLDMQTLLFAVNPGQSIDTITQKVLQYRLDGVIVFGATEASTLARDCIAANIPVVLFDIVVCGIGASCVCCNEEYHGRQVAQLFVERGYKNIAYISGDRKYKHLNGREYGFVKGLQDLGINNCAVEYGGYSYKGGMEAAQKLLDRNPEIDAIFCVCDNTALGAMDYIKYTAKKKIPEEVGIVGFDGIGAGANDAYNLTTICQPKEEMVKFSLEEIIKMKKEGLGKASIHIIDGELIERGSIR